MNEVNHCGECTACCRIYTIAEIPDKKAGDWCKHCAVGKGCKIYQDRPRTCVDFECLWLQSQSIPGAEMELELRPDRCKVVFAPTTNPNVIGATTMPGAPLAWQRPNVRKFIQRLINSRVGVAISGPGATIRKLVSLDGIKEVRMTEPDETGMQWNID